MGSDLHLWTVAMCNAMERKARLITRMSNWAYLDHVSCDPSSSAMTCYFPKSEMNCPTDATDKSVDKLYTGLGKIHQHCPSIEAEYNVSDIRAAGIEVLFAGASIDLVVNMARQQLYQLFGPAGAPPNLITVHMRWGDVSILDANGSSRRISEMSHLCAWNLRGVLFPLSESGR